MKHRRRNYGQYCGLAAALDVVGERWTLLIIRELLAGPCRYNEILANLNGIGTNLLAERLKFLAEAGLIRQRSREGTKVRVYELTDQGRSLREPVLSLARWGLGVLGAPQAEDQVRPRWGLLAVEAMIRPDAVEFDGEFDEEYEFRIDDEVFHVHVGGGDASVGHGNAKDPVLTMATDAVTFVEIGAGRLSPLEATLTKRLTMEGEEAAMLRCSRLLGLLA
jgi:DNA-binding HxlR family transcriptional regulator/putative sterol carrier protein